MNTFGCSKGGSDVVRVPMIHLVLLIFQNKGHSPWPLKTNSLCSSIFRVYMAQSPFMAVDGTPYCAMDGVCAMSESSPKSWTDKVWLVARGLGWWDEQKWYNNRIL